MRYKRGHVVFGDVQNNSGGHLAACWDLYFLTIQTAVDSCELCQLPRNYPLIKLATYFFQLLATRKLIKLDSRETCFFLHPAPRTPESSRLFNKLYLLLS